MVPMFAVTGRFAVGCEGRRGGAEGHESHGTSALESPRRGEGGDDLRDLRALEGEFAYVGWAGARQGGAARSRAREFDRA